MPLVPIGQAAEMLDVSIDTLRRWDKKGKVNSVRPDGKNRHYDIEELSDFKRNRPLMISEAAAYLGLTAVALRSCEKRGLITPSRDEEGNRIYSYGVINSFMEKNASQPEAVPAHEVYNDTMLKFSLSFIILVILTVSIYILDAKAKSLGYIARNYGVRHRDVLGIYVPRKPIRNMFNYLGNVTAYVVDEYRFAIAPNKIRDVNDVFVLEEGAKLVPKVPIRARR